jgi:hypothetical protein
VYALEAAIIFFNMLSLGGIVAWAYQLSTNTMAPWRSLTNWTQNVVMEDVVNDAIK